MIWMSRRRNMAALDFLKALLVLVSLGVAALTAVGFIVGLLVLILPAALR